MAKTKFELYEMALFLLRVGSGVMMVALHGWGKLNAVFRHFTTGEEWGFVGYVGSLGFPVPVVFATMAALGESVAAVLVAVGLYTRYAAAAMAGTMAVATYSHIIKGEMAELALMYLLVGLLFTVRGAGPLSLDHIIRKK